MNDLEKLANELIENESYEKEADSFGEFEEVDDGIYNVKLEDVTLRESKAGNKGLNFKLRHDNNQISWVGWYFTDKTYKRTLSRCMTLVKELGYEITKDMFSTPEVIEETMKQLIGENVVYTKETKNDFTNHSIHGN